MEATAALGLAGNVIQFVDFSLKLCHTFMEIRNVSSKGTTQSNADSQKRIETFLATLDKVTANLNIYSEVLSGADGNAQFEDVIERCKKIATDYLGCLKELKVEGKMGKWKAAVATVKTLWKEDELIELQHQLRRYREELMWIAVLSMRSNLSLLESWQKDQFSELQSAVIEKMTEVIRSQLNELPIFHVPGINKYPSPSRLYLPQSSDHFDEDESTSNPANRHLVSQPSACDQGTAIETSIAMAETIASRLAQNDRRILESLDFLVMRDRENAISEAATATFDWIFHESTQPQTPWSNFAKWLADKTSPGVYWINGKAGSGKSTLMKHLFYHQETRGALAEWADDSKMLLAGFFFSYNGEALQKSQEGLLRALLYACLKNHRELIPLVVSVSHRNNFSSDEYRNYWSLNRLEDAFRCLVSQKLVPLKFCFFVDGLDEYAGRHSDVTSMLVDAARHNHVKVCTSSRPLPTFEKSLSVFPGLILQHLTRSDIRQFVKGALNDNYEIKQLEIGEPGLIKSLALDITSKASGVFLWVTLVVGSLLEGSENYDDVADLRRRLEDLPHDLGELYWHMIQRVKPQWYLEEGFRLLLLVKAAGGSTNILALAFAEMNITCQYGTEEPLLMSPTLSEQKDNCKRLIGRMKARCLGLLEVSGSAGETVTTRVTFLHKSVSDFLDTDNAKQTITRYLGGKNFMPEKQIMRGMLWTLKTFQTRQKYSVGLNRKDFIYKVCPLVEEFIAMARNAEALTHDPQTEIVDELNRVTYTLWCEVTFKSEHEWLGLIHWTVAPKRAGDPFKAIDPDESLPTYSTPDEDNPSRPPVRDKWFDWRGSVRYLMRHKSELNSAEMARARLDGLLGNLTDPRPFVEYVKEQGLNLYAAARGIEDIKSSRKAASISHRTSTSGTELLRAADEIYGTEAKGTSHESYDTWSETYSTSTESDDTSSESDDISSASKGAKGTSGEVDDASGESDGTSSESKGANVASSEAKGAPSEVDDTSGESNTTWSESE